MEKNFIKNNPGALLTGTILLWYIISIVIDLIWLVNTPFSNLFILKKAYLGMTPVEVPLPETGILLFLLGSMLIIALYLLIEKEIPKKNAFKYVLGILGFSFVIFILLIPILVMGEIAYSIIVDTLCASISWLEWFKVILDKFSFNAEVQASFMKNPIKLDMSLGGFLALYIGIPKIRERLKV